MTEAAEPAPAPEDVATQDAVPDANAIAGAADAEGKGKGRRGRPRPQDTIARDNTVYELVAKTPLTRSEIADKLGVEPSAVYLSLFRLNREQRVRKTSLEGRVNVWEAVPE